MIFTYIIITLLLFTIFALAFYLWKFAKIIMIFEDDLSEAINSLNDVEDKVKNVLQMQMFFDSPEVKKETEKILEQLRISRFQIQNVISRFTARSKRQYVTVWENEPINAEEEDTFNPFLEMPGQPPGTPNPMDILYKEGMINVKRQRR